MKALFICFLLFSMVMLNQNTLVDGNPYEKIKNADKSAFDKFKKVTEGNRPPGREEANKYNRGCSHLTRCRD